MTLPPTQLDSGYTEGLGKEERREQTSTKKCARTAQVQVIEKYASDQKERFERVMEVGKKAIRPWRGSLKLQKRFQLVTKRGSALVLV